MRKRISKFTGKEMTPSPKDYIEHYALGKNGMVVGYRLHNKYNISTQISKNTEIITNIYPEESVIDVTATGRIMIRFVDIEFTDIVKQHISVLEVVENDNIQDFNNRSFGDMIDKFVDIYDDDIMMYILDRIDYKEETVAKVKEVTKR